MCPSIAWRVAVQQELDSEEQRREVQGRIQLENQALRQLIYEMARGNGTKAALVCRKLSIFIFEEKTYFYNNAMMPPAMQRFRKRAVQRGVLRAESAVTFRL